MYSLFVYVVCMCVCLYMCKCLYMFVCVSFPGYLIRSFPVADDVEHLQPGDGEPVHQGEHGVIPLVRKGKGAEQ